MGFLERSDGIPNFTKAVISIWFGVEQEVLDAVSALDDNPVGFQGDGFNGGCFYPPLNKIIPLWTFGSLETTFMDSEVADELPVSPSFVGIDCYAGEPTLAVNLQMNNRGTYSKPGDGTELRPACFYMGGGAGSLVPDKTTITGDVWHHALISFDLSSSCSANYPPSGSPVFTPGPTFTWALDDVDKTGSAMSPSGGWANDLADEVIIPNCLVESVPAAGLSGTDAEWETTSLEADGSPAGIPTSSGFTSKNKKIRVAGMQVFLHVTTDVRVEGNRRAFITSTGRPVSPTSAAAAMGKSPEIHFQTHEDYIAGINRGTAGNFDPTGTINPYSPAP